LPARNDSLLTLSIIAIKEKEIGGRRAFAQARCVSEINRGRALLVISVQKRHVVNRTKATRGRERFKWSNSSD
jgi:hypothetical protein